MDRKVSEHSTLPQGGPEHFPTPMTGSIEEIDLRDLFRKIWRRKGIIFSTVVVLTVLATIVLFQIAPRYTAETLILIESRNANVTDVEAVLSGLSSDAETIQSEILVMGSRGLAKKVVGKLKLNQDPEFNATLRPKGFFSDFDLKSMIPKEWMAVLTGKAEPEPLSEEDIRSQAEVRIINTFLESLEIMPKGRSRVISLSVTAENPKTAAKVANTLADLYIVEQLEAKFEATQRATNWLNERVGGLRVKVKASERLVEKFRKESGLISSGKGVTLIAQQVSEVNTQLILSKTQRAEADARLRQIRKLVKSTGGVESVAEVLESKLIQKLREQEAEVQRKAAELSTEYGKKHPKIINVRAEALDLKAKIEGEVNKIVRRLENEVAIADVREATLQKSFDQLKEEMAKSNKAEIQLRALEREAKANRTLLETFLSRFKETSAQEDLDIQQADARIISMADRPEKPSFPKKKLILALVLVGSIFVGLMLVFVIEQLDSGFRSGEEIERATGLPVLGLVPMLTGLSKIGKPPETYILEKPTSAFGEAIRTLHTSILLSDVDEPIKTILITSALPNEGKTTTAVCLARMQALAGHKVIMIDADYRRPNIAKVIGIDSRPGLVELLAGNATLEEVIKKDDASGAHVITTGAPAPNPPDLLASDHMRKLLDTLSQTYDLVVLDSPPVMAVSDARVLSTEVDATVFAVRWADTRREIASLALKQLALAGGRIVGVVLTMVDAKKHARYGYGDSGYYYGPIKKYYTG